MGFKFIAVWAVMLYEYDGNGLQMTGVDQSIDIGNDASTLIARLPGAK